MNIYMRWMNIFICKYRYQVFKTKNIITIVRIGTIINHNVYINLCKIKLSW